MPQNPVAVPLIAVSASGVGTPKVIAGTSHTLAPSDLSRYLRFTNGGAVTLSVPTNAAVPLPIGATFSFIQAGAGVVTVTPAGGVTVNSPSGKVATASQFAVATLVKVGANEWDLMGNLA